MEFTCCGRPPDSRPKAPPPNHLQGSAMTPPAWSASTVRHLCELEHQRHGRRNGVTKGTVCRGAPVLRYPQLQQAKTPWTPRKKCSTASRSPSTSEKGSTRQRRRSRRGTDPKSDLGAAQKCWDLHLRPVVCSGWWFTKPVAV